MKSEVHFSETTSKLCNAVRKAVKPALRLKKFKARVDRTTEVLKNRFADNLSKEQEQFLKNTAKLLMEPGKGILSADDSVRQLDMKLKAINLEPWEQHRRRYNEMLLSMGMQVNYYLSGVLMKEDVITQKAYRGKRLTAMLKEANIKLGIRADKGLVPIAGTANEWTSTGYDGLEDACKRFKDLGAVFTLWRCVYTIGPHTPSRLALVENSNTLARYAVVSQRVGLVPIVSPEMHLADDHSQQTAQHVLRDILSNLVVALYRHQVYMEGVIIRITAAMPGRKCPKSCLFTSVGEGTLKIVNECIPPAIGGIMLASLGDLNRSIEVLDEMNKCPIKKPTLISFCFSHVIQEGVDKIWMGQDRNVLRAHDVLIARAKSCSVASMGQCQEQNCSMFISNISRY